MNKSNLIIAEVFFLIIDTGIISIY